MAVASTRHSSVPPHYRVTGRLPREASALKTPKNAWRDFGVLHWTVPVNFGPLRAELTLVLLFSSGYAIPYTIRAAALSSFLNCTKGNFPTLLQFSLNRVFSVGDD